MQHVVYTDEYGYEHVVYDDDTLVYSDEDGVERVVTVEEVKVIARALRPVPRQALSRRRSW